LSGLVKTQFGYHIIKVTGRKEGKIVEFDKVKDLLTQKVTAEKQKEAFDSYMEGLKKSYTVEKNKEAIAGIGSSIKGKGKPEAEGDKTGQPSKTDNKK
jgi:peptidyl-prolyl cis-trans isomerase C